MKKLSFLFVFLSVLALSADAHSGYPYTDDGGGAPLSAGLINSALGYTPAHSGANSDITSLTGLTTPLSVGQGGTNNASAYTAGSIIYSNGTALTQDNANLFWDGTNHRLGIGTTSPVSPLQVVSGTTNYLTFNPTTNNTFVGLSSGNLTLTGGSNTANGSYALNSDTSGGSNTANGAVALRRNTIGGDNTANGYSSLGSNTTGSNNTANGMYSLLNNTTGSNNTANGVQSLYNNTTNVATLGSITGGTLYTPGTYTGVVMTLSSGSSAATYPTANIVVNAGGNVSSVTIVKGLAGVGFKDTTTVLTAPAASIGGTGSGFSVPVATLHTGGSNTALGYLAGQYISDGSTVNSWSTNSLYLGLNAYPLADGDINETVIGYGATGNGSNTVTLGNSSVTDTYLQGTLHGTGVPTLSSLGGVATVSNVNKYMGGGENPQSVAANAVTCDWSLGSTCVVATQNAATAWTLTMSNPVAGQIYRIRFVQNATGGASAAPLPTFSPAVRAWQGNQTPALTTTANKVDYASCFYSAVTPTGYDCKISNTY